MAGIATVMHLIAFFMAASVILCCAELLVKCCCMIYTVFAIPGHFWFVMFILTGN